MTNDSSDWLGLPTDKLEPVIMIVLYFGEEEWTGPRCLHDMLVLQDFPETLRKYVNDYQLYIFEVNRFEHLEYFQIVRIGLGNLWMRMKQSWQLWKKMPMITDMAHSEELVQLKEKYQKEGKVDMCKGLRDWMVEERRTGELIGEVRFATLTQRLLREYRTDDLLKATSSEEYRKTLYKEFKI